MRNWNIFKIDDGDLDDDWKSYVLTPLIIISALALGFILFF